MNIKREHFYHIYQLTVAKLSKFETAAVLQHLLNLRGNLLLAKTVQYSSRFYWPSLTFLYSSSLLNLSF